MSKRIMVSVLVVFALTSICSAANLVSWWQMGREGSPYYPEQLSASPIASGAEWYRLMDTVNDYQSNSGFNNVIAKSYTGSSHGFPEYQVQCL